MSEQEKCDRCGHEKKDHEHVWRKGGHYDDSLNTRCMICPCLEFIVSKEQDKCGYPNCGKTKEDDIHQWFEREDDDVPPDHEFVSLQEQINGKSLKEWCDWILKTKESLGWQTPMVILAEKYLQSLIDHKTHTQELEKCKIEAKKWLDLYHDILEESDIQGMVEDLQWFVAEALERGEGERVFIICVQQRLENYSTKKVYK